MKIEAKKNILDPITLPEYEFTIQSPEFTREGEKFVIWFFEGILENNPNYIDCLMYLGNAYTANGMYEKGLWADQKLSRLKPYDPTVHYNLACSHALLENLDAAFDALEKAIKLGYKDIYHLEQDEDLTVLRKDIRYKKLVEKMKSIIC